MGGGVFLTPTGTYRAETEISFGGGMFLPKEMMNPKNSICFCSSEMSC